MITIESKGSFNNIERFLKKAPNMSLYDILDRYGREGVISLQQATPSLTGRTANAWDYVIEIEDGSSSITFVNSSSTDDGTPITILLQYGHLTGSGGYVRGIDYINPAIKPIFDAIAEDSWKEVQSL